MANVPDFRKVEQKDDEVLIIYPQGPFNLIQDMVGHCGSHCTCGGSPVKDDAEEIYVEDRPEGPVIHVRGAHVQAGQVEQCLDHCQTASKTL
ncbi:MAG: hypothetical protein OWS74_07450, partial [Firmicutes bacterium]|nr:hypothetical protein [Bacillota bacterium]